MKLPALSSNWLEHSRSGLLREKETIRICFLAVFVWGMIAHAYGFVHCSLSHDVLNAFVAGTAENNSKIMFGRYFVPVYRAIFRGPVVLPWLIGLWGLLWNAISVCMVVHLLEVRSKFRIVLISGVMVTNITVISQIATYLHEYDVNAFSLVLAIGAVCLWRYRADLLNCILGGLCLMVSMGIYQSFVAVTVTLIIWLSIVDLLYEKSVKRIFVNGLWGILMVLLGGVLYALIMKVVHAATGVMLESRMDLTAGEEAGGLLAVYARLIIPAIIDLCGNLAHNAYYRIPQIVAIACIVVLLAVLSVRIFKRKKFTWDRLILIGILCLALPFGLNCVYFLAKGEGMHDVTTYATWFFYIILLQLAFWVFENLKESHAMAHFSVAAASILVICILWQNVTLSNTAYVKKQMEVDSTLSTMTRVVAMLEQRDDYVVGETKIAMVGVPQNLASRPVFDKVRTITGMDMETAFYGDAASTYYNNYEAYFRYVMNYPVNLCVGEERWEKVVMNPRVKAMPAFPKEGCMEMIDDILVIKVG